MRGLLLAFSLAFATAPLSAQPAAPPRGDRIEALAETLDQPFLTFMADAHVPGLAFGVVADGRLAYVQTFGSRTLASHDIVTPDSLFRIASMSKAFTALAILKLRDEGRLSLDALAETYVPEMRGWRYPTSDSPRIRVRDLLSHTAGFVTDDPWGDRQQVLSEADFTRLLRSGVPFTRAPQTAFEYSNLGYALLGRIITNVSRRPYADYIRDEIMRPLGMASTGYDVFASPQDRRALGWRWENEAFAREPDMAHGTFGAMGGVETSARDYARWVAFLLSAWPARDGPETGPVRRSTVRELAQGLNFVAVARRPGDPQSCPQAAAYGMGFRAALDCELGLTLAHGGGYRATAPISCSSPSTASACSRCRTAPMPGLGPGLAGSAGTAPRGLLNGRTLLVSAALERAYQGTRAMWLEGSVEPGRDLLAINMLMDRSAENWALEFERLKSEAGACNSDAPLTATGALSARFSWICERGQIEGQILLAPTDPPTIQALRMNVRPIAP